MEIAKARARTRQTRRETGRERARTHSHARSGCVCAVERHVHNVTDEPAWLKPIHDDPGPFGGEMDQSETSPGHQSSLENLMDGKIFEGEVFVGVAREKEKKRKKKRK